MAGQLLINKIGDIFPISTVEYTSTNGDFTNDAATNTIFIDSNKAPNQSKLQSLMVPPFVNTVFVRARIAITSPGANTFDQFRTAFVDLDFFRGVGAERAYIVGGKDWGVSGNGPSTVSFDYYQLLGPGATADMVTAFSSAFTPIAVTSASQANFTNRPINITTIVQNNVPLSDNLSPYCEVRCTTGDILAVPGAVVTATFEAYGILV